MKKAKLPLGRGLKKERDNFPIFTFCTTEKNFCLFFKNNGLMFEP